MAAVAQVRWPGTTVQDRRPCAVQLGRVYQIHRERDTQMKLRGQRIELGEVENMYRSVSEM